MIIEKTSQKTRSRIINSFSLPAFLFAAVFVLCSIMLIPSIHAPVTGYLHSWNQVTTLVLIKQIAENPISFSEPKDVVTRVTWQPDNGDIDMQDRSARFIIYEEFPLYHLISAAISILSPTLEGGARLTSVFFFFFGAIGLHSLSRRSANSQTALYTLLLYVTSFPFLYYGQAVMSDMAMVAAAIWGINFLSLYTEKREKLVLYAAAGSLAISGLFKSYGIVLVLSFLYLYLYKHRWRLVGLTFSRLSLLVCISILPAVLWHAFAYVQGGVQEFGSHSVSAKLRELSDPLLYRSLVNTWFRYLGYLPGIFLILAALFKSSKSSWKIGLENVPWWFNKGPHAYGHLRSEQGVHRLVRISPFDSNARRHTSFASVAVTPDIEEDIEIELDDKELRIDTYRSSGAGGQHVNKTDSAVRITHIPTGIVVACQNERSQHKNKDRAMKTLKSKLYELRMAEQREMIDQVKGERKSIAFGSQIRSYVMQPYQMVKDLRTRAESSDVGGVMDGDIDQFIEAYLLSTSRPKGA